MNLLKEEYYVTALILLKIMLEEMLKLKSLMRRKIFKEKLVLVIEEQHEMLNLTILDSITIQSMKHT